LKGSFFPHFFSGGGGGGGGGDLGNFQKEYPCRVIVQGEPWEKKIEHVLSTIQVLFLKFKNSWTSYIEDMIDHRSYTHNRSSCEIKA